MREKPPVDLKRCCGNGARNRRSTGGNAACVRRKARCVRKTATRFEALPRECAKSRQLSVGVVFLASRGRCTPLATSSFGASRGAVEGAKSRRRGGLRNRGTRPMVPAHEKGVRANMTRTPIKTRCSTVVHVSSKMKRSARGAHTPAFTRPLRTASCTVRHRSRRERGAPRGCLLPRYRHRAGRG